MKQKRQQQNPEQKITKLEKQLTLKNRELKIETGLEKVRNKAMRMKKPDDMLDVCKTISLQLESLGVNEIRNIQTAIFYQQLGTYMNYEYYAKHNKTFITETSYTNHKMHKEFARKMLKGKGEIFVTHIKGKKVKDWIAYQKTTNVFIDKYLKTASSVNYYWFSLGPVALGISTYRPLTEEEIYLFKRFLKVFELAYRRYLDIEKAEAQAREARIEASLERVRAVAMSMNKSEELLSVSEILHMELYKLGFNEIRNAMINIHNDENKTFLNYDYSDEIGKSITLLNFNTHPVMEKQINQSRMANDAFSEAVYKGKDLEEWKKFRRKYGEKDDQRIEKIKALYYYFYSIGSGTIGISTFSPINEEKLSLLKRFRNVFSLAYQRYSDISLAEAQAREAQIELALERIRSRTMAMHKSDELSETAYVLFEQFRELGENPDQLSIGTVNDVERTLELWLTVRGNKFDRMFKVPIDEPIVINKIYTAWKRKKKSFVLDVSGDELKKYNSFRNNIPDFKDYNKVKNSGNKEEQRRVIYCAFFKRGLLSLATPEPRPEETLKLLERFAGVFDLTYTRFLDLQKAEEQAREAQIETALERVRASSMAMHKSNELLDVISVVSNQLDNLGFRFDIVSFAANNQEFDYNFWLSIKGQRHPYLIYVPYIDNPMFERVKKAQSDGQTFYTDVLTKEENRQWHQHLFEHNQLDFVTDKLKKYVFNRGYARSIALLPNIMLIVGNYSSQLYSDEENNIIKRFANVFDQAYRRFLDLQKAEAQAREAEIELALERVRARTMAMQKSEELREVIRLVYEQFVHLKINVDHAGFVVDYTPRGDWHFWIADERDIPSKISHPYFESVWAIQFNEAKEKGVHFFATNLNFEEKNKFYNELLSYIPGLTEASRDFYLSCPALAGSTVLSENVGLYIENFSGIPYSDEENKILMRFGKVFQQTYTRFLDLQRAEVQAREAQIESSLERVRAVAMSMHASDDLLSICEVTFKEFQKLGFENLRNALIHIPNDEEKFFMDYDFSELMGGAINKIKYGAHPIVDDYLEKIRSAKDAFAEVVINEDQLKGWKKFRKESGQYDDPRLDKATALYYYLHSIGIGDIGISTLKPIDENQIKILKRFRNVFDLAYRRYNDIALAEEQARETQIQLALERVRARTMAMHKSEELSETSLVLFNQLKDLGEVAEQISIGIFNVDEGVFELYATIYGSQWEETGRFPLTKHPVHKKTYEAWKEQKKSLIIDLTGEKLEDFNKFKMETSTQYKSEDELPKNRWVVHSAFFSKGVLTFSTHEPRPLKTLQLLERFANVFDLTYTRFLDLQKAEAQARESQIEASLERVRAKAMAMHSSSDLSDTMGVLFKELPKLGINSLRCGVVLLSKKSTQGIFYAAATTLESDSFTMIGAGDMKKHPVFTNQYECWLQKENYFLTLSGEELAAYYKEIFARVSKTYNPREHKLQSEHGYYFAFSEGMFYAWSEEAYSEESINILNRFKAIIDLTFRRYLDLQKAEAQAKEAKIEASLERVRSKAMSMHNSKDLAETLGVFYRELKSLSVTPRRCGVALMNKETRMAELTTMNTTEEGDSIEVVGQIKMAGHPVLDNVFENWLIQKEYQTVLRGNQIKEYYQILKPQISYPDYPHDVVQFGYYFMFNEGDVYAWTEKELTEDELKIYRRFTTVISLTYKRYIDLQQAEAQAREAEIEAALERVRSRTMAMQKSNELADTASHFFEQLNSLDIKSYRFNIAIVDAESEKCRLWSTTNEGKVIPAGPFVPLTEHNVLNQMYEGWKLRQNVLIIKLLGEERINWTNYIMNFVSFNEYKPENIDLEKLRTEPAIFSNFFFKQGFVVLHTIEEIDKSDLKIIRRFVNVFEQTYTRFLDLQKAEAQAREAKIEASLERVRSKAMSMHSSEDLSETVNIFFKELKALEIIPIRCGVGQIDVETRTTSLTTTTSSQQGDSFQVIGKVKQTGHPILDGIFDHWKLQKEYHPVLEGKDIKVYYDVMNPQIGYPVYSEDVTQYGNNFYFKEGFVFAWTEHKLSEEELQIFRRFTSVIGLTYRRYLDLKEAEARAIESIRQASLDRIRAEIASMRTSEDLNRITPIVWRELKNLDVPFFRCGVYIINEAQEKVQVYLTTPDGKSLGVLNLSFDSNQITNNTVEHWRKKQVHKVHWNKEDFINWTNSLIEIGQVQNAKSYQGSANPPDSLDLHFVPFTQGMLYVGDVQPLTDEKLELVKTLAEAFSIAYARYEDFRKLEEAKNKIEVTLNELKAAQAQLVHSEKMASLGELTAGIAHEIKNPLNFVNNFSEVSRELLDEMQIEIKNNNINEVINLVEDLKQNLDKINQHGKRADSIVKGMLLHSRGTSGEKTLTDINDLLDQYVNLAYHGMRAQNKEFNITIEKDYDKTLEKINVVPQDISRVFLNIINNACYAAFDKKKKGENNFSPTLKVSTKKINKKVEIRIGDNGNGIPADHLDKIFQPFFTTKPTGEGTGLGLSLSYDIVTKVHGGELKVETKEGVGTEFIIILNN